MTGDPKVEVEHERATRRSKLDSRLKLVARDLADLPRDGHAEVYKNGALQYAYDYVTEASLMAALRPLLAKHGVALYYGDEILNVHYGDRGNAITVRVHFTFAAAGERFHVSADGYATDFGDKAANKAKTHATRYLLTKMFLQGGGVDPELETDATEPINAPRPAGSSSPRRNEEDAPRLVQRVTQLAGELDATHGLPAGRSLGEIIDKVQIEHSRALGDLPAADLVKIGTALAAHVAAEREASEKAGLEFTPTPFSLPR